MVDSDTKRFINDVLIGFADELRLILTDYSSFIERMYDAQNEKLDEIAKALDFIADKLP